MPSDAMRQMDANPLGSLERLGEQALGPCIGCDKVMLETALPLFNRVQIQRCGIDAAEVRRHVGLAMAMGGGPGGLALAGAMGPTAKPVAVIETYTVNVCAVCSETLSFQAILYAAMAAAEAKAEREQDDAD